jgi:hypothetical protein
MSLHFLSAKSKRVSAVLSLILSLLLIFSIAGQAASATLFAPPNNLGLVGYWSFNDGNGTTATDFSGQGHNGTLENLDPDTAWIDGRQGKALTFSGISSGSSDFKIQRGSATIASNALSTTITAGTDYTAPASINKAFIRIVSSTFAGSGLSGRFSGAPSTNSVYISNPGNLLTSITFARGSSAGIVDIEYEIIEYTGEVGGANEMVVRQAQSFQEDGLTKDGDTVSGVVDDDDVVVFITGQGINSSVNRGESESYLHTAEWVSGSQVARITRGDATRSGSLVSFAVVEFTGSNWTVQRVEHTYTSAGGETIAITPVADMAKTFIHAQYRVHGGASIGVSADLGSQEVYLDSTSQLEGTIDTIESGANPTAVVWVIENSGNMNVERYKGTWDGDDVTTTLDVPITAVASLSTASVMGETAYTTFNGEDQHYNYLNFTLSDLDTATLSRANGFEDRNWSFEVVEWPSSSSGGGGEGGNEYVSIGSLTPTIKTISFWFNSTTTNGSILQLSGSANVKLVDGVITPTGFASSTIYVDGVATSTASTGWHEVTITTSTGITASDVKLGRVGSSYFGGTLDEVRFYNRTLGSSEAASYSHGQVVFDPTSPYKTTINASQNNKLTSGLVGLWSFDGPDISGSTAYDRSGEGNDGTFASGTALTIGVIGQAIKLDGVDDYVDAGNITAWDLSSYTISGWFKTSSTSGFKTIISRNTDTFDRSWWIAIDQTTSDLVFKFSAEGTNLVALDSGSSVADGVWHHFAAVLESGSYSRLYVGGVLVDSDGTGTGALDVPDAAVIIGNDPTDTGRYFSGDLDDIRIYNRALSGEEVERLYGMGR